MHTYANQSDNVDSFVTPLLSLIPTIVGPRAGFFVFFPAIPPKASAERHGSGKRELILYQNLSH